MYGRETDHSLVGDWDGDGVDTPGVFRGGPRLKAAGECAPLNEGRSRYTTDNANRVSLVIAERYGTSYAKFVNCHKQWDGSYYEEWQTPTRIGANGMATVGEPAAWHTYKTPTGSYSVTESFGVYNPRNRSGLPPTQLAVQVGRYEGSELQPVLRRTEGIGSR